MSIPLPDGVSPADLTALIQDKYDGSTENRHLLSRDIARLATGEPLAYVVGWMPFLGLRIYLDSRPLIPRPETEWWTEQLIAATKNGNELRFLDLCAGSGAVGCALLKAFPGAHVSFGELVPEHEATIRKNIRENSLDETRTDIRIGDLFVPFGTEKFDLIAVNPPYIPEKRKLEKSVANFEPREALAAGKDGLTIIARIARGAAAHMNPGGALWLECDTEHAEIARGLVEGGGAKNTEIRNDQYGRPRVIIGYY
jgi:release factor glutamine methyltransferase